jgi:hypothetical protein
MTTVAWLRVSTLEVIAALSACGPIKFTRVGLKGKGIGPSLAGLHWVDSLVGAIHHGFHQVCKLASSKMVAFQIGSQLPAAI